MKVYLDHAATTYILPEVAEAMQPALSDCYGNPSGAYEQSRRARSMVDAARGQVAGLINADESEIYFTSGGTEADNWAIKGAALKRREMGRHIITCAIEHKAVLSCCEYMERLGWKVDYLPTDVFGRIDPASVESAITSETAIVSVMAANNEIGTLQPIGDIAEICRRKGVLFHTDAVQAAGSIPVDVKALGVDMLSLSAHKFYGPKGAGALYIRKGVALDSLLHGGQQERSLRPGTENVPGIVGLGKAAEIAARDLDENAARISGLRNRLIDGLMQIPGTRLNGHPEDRLPGNVHVCFAGVEGELMLLRLDMEGISASAGSACASGSLHASHVLEAIGVDRDMLPGALRLTLGRDTTQEGIDYTVNKLIGIVGRLRGHEHAFNQLPEEAKFL